MAEEVIVLVLDTLRHIVYSGTIGVAYDRADNQRGQCPQDELSGDQQQRVAIARALANSPRILIGDEVTGELDTESGLSIMRLLPTLNDEGMTIIFVTHDPRMAEFADRVIQLRDGRLLGN